MKSTFLTLHPNRGDAPKVGKYTAWWCRCTKGKIKRRQTSRGLRRGHRLRHGDDKALLEVTEVLGGLVTWTLEPGWVECATGHPGGLQQRTDVISHNRNSCAEQGWKGAVMERVWIWDEAGLTSGWDVDGEKE